MTSVMNAKCCVGLVYLLHNTYEEEVVDRRVTGQRDHEFIHVARVKYGAMLLFFRKYGSGHTAPLSFLKVLMRCHC